MKKKMEINLKENEIRHISDKDVREGVKHVVVNQEKGSVLSIDEMTLGKDGILSI